MKVKVVVEGGTDSERWRTTYLVNKEDLINWLEDKLENGMVTREEYEQARRDIEGIGVLFVALPTVTPSEYQLPINIVDWWILAQMARGVPYSKVKDVNPFADP